MHVGKATLDSFFKEDTLVIPSEPIKTLIAFAIFSSGMLSTSVSLAIIHDYVPTNISALPDFFLDHVTYQQWGLDASEVVLLVNVSCAMTVMVFHKYNMIIFRYKIL